MGRTSGSHSKSRPAKSSSGRRAKFDGGRSPDTPRGGGGGGAAAAQDRRVFVGNLRYETSWQLLKDHMRSAGGNVVHADILSTPDGRSKGCGIVEYASAKDARKAIRELNESELDGRTIFLREDREAGASAGGGGGGDDGTGCTVFVGNLPWEAKWHDLKDHMREAGNVAHVEILEGRDGRSKGCAIVEYEHPREAARALRDLDGTNLMGRELFVQPDERDGGGGGGGGTPSRSQSHSHDGERDCRIFVGNLSYETSWQTLKDFMRKAGNVSRADILQDSDGRSKGCGIVEYEHPKDAARALRELNEDTLDGRTVYVQEDRGPDEGGSGGGGSDRGGGGDDGGGDQCQLYVGNLTWDTKWQQLKDHFKQCGDVQRAEVIEVDGRSKGFGTVRFFNARDADEAIRRLDGTELDGRRIHVRLDHKA